MQTSIDIAYGYVRTVHLAFDEAISGVEAALKQEGFGSLCRIDIAEKFREKLGVEFPRYIILGVCNPPLAYQALEKDINLGLLFPCNVAIYERNGEVMVGAVDAVRMLSVVGNPAMNDMASQVNEKLRRAVDAVAPAAA